MNSRILALVLPASLLIGGFVYFSAGSLPPAVASHFAAGGAANGFMARESYVALMVALTAGPPLLFALLTSLIRNVPPERVSLPNGDYWLAPERRAKTLAFLQWHGAFLGVLIAVFLGLVHWLVLRANATQPPHLSESAFLIALLSFLVIMAAWVATLFLRFRRPS